MKITWVKWSSTHPVLTSGNEKGYLNFYFKKNKRKVPTMGKHSKRVVCGDWNNEGLLVTGSEDKLITISNHNSDNAANSLAVKAEPRDLKWMTMKSEERNKKQTTICGVFNQKTLLIHDITQDRSAPLELMFESKYGKIIDYQFYGDGYIVVGFGEGYYCHVSTHEKEMKDEIKSERVFNAPLEAMAVNNPFYKMALAGENKIKIISLGDWKEIKQETIELPPGSGKVASMNFSPNGNTLIIVTQSGTVYGYILSTAVLISTYNELVAMLSSLSEVVLLSCSSKKKGQLINNINLPFEPTGISLGPNHLAARLGNTVKFYRWLRDKMLISGGEEVNEIQCEYNVKRVEVGDGWAALLDDKNKLHLV
jgi:WD repeat-containing protein 19